MATLSVIYDGNLPPRTIQETERFNQGDFILIDIINPTLANNEGILIGLAILLEIPIIGRTAIKYVPHQITDFEINARELGDSKELIAIPQEFSNSEYNFFVGLNSSEEVSLRVYVIDNYQNDIDDVYDNVDEVKRLISQIIDRQNLDLALNVAQNVSIGIIGTGLIPITAGVTTPVPAIVTSPIRLLPSL